MVLLPLMMRRHLRHCQASIVTLIAHHQAGIVALVVLALLSLMRRHLHCCHDCKCCPHDDGIVAIVNAQASLSLSSWCQCLCNNCIAALDLQWCCCPCCNGIIAVLKLVLFFLVAMAVLLSSAGILAIITMALLPLLQWHCCC